MKSHVLAASLATLALLAAGCGGGGPCHIRSVTVSPQNATADHTASPPGNQVQFNATADCICGGPPLWSVSDTTNVTIGPGGLTDPHGGLATCLGATAGPVTVSALLIGCNDDSASGTATLICK